MFEKFIDVKIATDPLGLLKYFGWFIPVFLSLLFVFKIGYEFPLPPVLLSVLFYGIPFLLYQFFIYALIFYFFKKKTLFYFSVVAISFFSFEFYSLVFYNEFYFIHEIKEGRMPLISVIVVLSALITGQMVNTNSNEKPA